MPTDRSLDEFVSGNSANADGQGDIEESTPDEERGDPGGETEVDASEDGDGDDVVPMRPTFSTRGAACAACGERVSERWRDGEELVCVECKEW